MEAPWPSGRIINTRPLDGTVPWPLGTNLCSGPVPGGPPPDPNAPPALQGYGCNYQGLESFQKAWAKLSALQDLVVDRLDETNHVVWVHGQPRVGLSPEE